MPKRSSRKAPKKNITDTVADVVRAVTGAQTGNPPILTAETDAAERRVKSTPPKKVKRKTGPHSGKEAGRRGRQT